jgi:hypothetical protein
MLHPPAAGKPTVVSSLLEALADPDIPNGKGYTPLYGALVQEHIKTNGRLK